MSIKSVSLGDVCSVKGGYAFKSSDFINKGFPVLKIANITNNLIEFDNNSSYLDEKNVNKYSEYIVEQGDILIALSGATTGKYGIYEHEYKALLNQRVGRVRPKSNLIDSKYLYYFMSKLQEKILYKAGGAAQPNISTDEIAKLLIPLPSLDIQVQITKVLDLASELINKRKAQIEALDQLTRSVFLELFGDIKSNPNNFNKVPISDLIEKVNNKNLKKFPDEIIKYIDISSINNNLNKIVSYSEYSGEDAPSRAKQIVKSGDILISTVRPNLKNVALIEGDFDNLIASTGFCVLRPKNNIERAFLFHIVKSEFFTNLLTNITSGANYPAVKPTDITMQNIINPPMELQVKFSKIYTRIEKQKILINRSLLEFQSNFNSIMQRAFKEELFNQEKIPNA